VLTGILAVIMIWALLVAWVAKVSQAQGRSVILWVLAAVTAGGFGGLLGLYLMNHMVAGDASTGVMLLGTFMPVILTLVPMIGIGLAIKRSPIQVSAKSDWPVHFVNRGEGQLRIRDGRIALEWKDGSREAAVRELAGVEADGECVRVRFANDDELCFMPLGKPETPAGRRQQSVQLARRLR
jgi:hypothetical protein